MTANFAKIGQFLREQREARHITLETVSDALCLRRSVIEAIESGNGNTLPHKVYVKSYIKEYAKFLGVYEEVESDLVEEAEGAEPAQHVQIRRKKDPLFKNLIISKVLKKAIAYSFIIALFMGFYFMEKNRRDFTAVPETDHTAQVSRSAEVSGEDKIVPTITEGKKLVISCMERTWVSVIIDGSEKKEFMLNANEMIALQGQETFDLLIGNAGGVKLILNGKDIDFTGKSGEVKRIKLS